MTNFNLEHAKRGCVVSIFNIYDMTNRVYLCRLIEDNEYYDLQSSWTIEVGDEYLIKGMATLEEWEAAGFKRENYIEPPPSSEELAELRKDKERLDWMIKNNSYIEEHKFKTGNEFMVVIGVRFISVASNPREAIAKAMKGGE